MKDFIIFVILCLLLSQCSSNKHEKVGRVEHKIIRDSCTNKEDTIVIIYN
jgi:hypothetical protein